MRHAIPWANPHAVSQSQIESTGEAEMAIFNDQTLELDTSNTFNYFSRAAIDRK